MCRAGAREAESLNGGHIGEISEQIEPLGPEDAPDPQLPGLLLLARRAIWKRHPGEGGMKIRAPPQLWPFPIHNLASLIEARLGWVFCHLHGFGSQCNESR